MLTISSIGVGPRPQQTPVANPPPPVAAGRASPSVGRDNSAGTVVSVTSGDGTGAQTTYLPSSLPPVAGPGEAAQADLPKNLQPAAVEAPAQAARFKGELPAEPRSAAEQALDVQIEEFIPNLWKASRAAVDALAASAEADAPEGPRTEFPVNETPYARPEGGKPPASPGALIDIEV
jgi:hypothetical protein